MQYWEYANLKLLALASELSLICCLHDNLYISGRNLLFKICESTTIHQYLAYSIANVSSK